MHIDPMAPGATLTDVESRLALESLGHLAGIVSRTVTEVKHGDPFTTVVNLDLIIAVATLTRELILDGSGAPWTPAS